jgi:hypothetical protein
VPYADPEKQRAANRVNKRRERARNGSTVDRLAGQVQDAAGLPDPPTRDFLLRALGVQALEGNVPAIRLLLEEYRRDGDTDTKPARGAIDELAGRRAERAS